MALINVGFKNSTPTFADLDADGDFDALIGEYYGTLKYYQNTGGRTNPFTVSKQGTANPFNGINVGGFSTPTFADLDADGDLDAVIGGTIRYS
jgi:hypothetical protein